MQVVLPRPPHRPQDIPTPVRLAADQFRVFGQLRLALQLLDQFRRHELDRGERRAQFMRRGRHHATKVGQLLLPRERHLRGQKRLAHRMAFRGDAAGIGRQEDDPDGDGGPESEDEQVGKLQDLARGQREGHVKIGQKRDQNDSQRAEDRGRAHRQSRGRDGDRREDQQRERVVQPTGQEQKERQLRKVEQKRQHRVAVAQSLVFRKDRHRDQVRDDRRADGEETQAQLDPKAEIEAGGDDRDRLPQNGEPAQHQQRAQSDPVTAGVVTDEVERWIRHSGHQGRSVAVAGS